MDDNERSWPDQTTDCTSETVNNSTPAGSNNRQQTLDSRNVETQVVPFCALSEININANNRDIQTPNISSNFSRLSDKQNLFEPNTESESNELCLTDQGSTDSQSDEQDNEDVRSCDSNDSVLIQSQGEDSDSDEDSLPECDKHINSVINNSVSVNELPQARASSNLVLNNSVSVSELPEPKAPTNSVINNLISVNELHGANAQSSSNSVINNSELDGTTAEASSSNNSQSSVLSTPSTSNSNSETATAESQRSNKNTFDFDALETLDFNESNSNLGSHSNKIVDFFRSRKYNHRTSPVLLNSHPGKRPHNFTLDKAARPCTKSSKLCKPVSASFKSKQALLASFSHSNNDFKKLPSIKIDNVCVDLLGYNNCALPVHILTHIFSYLALYDLLRTASCVCRFWYSAAFDPALWRFVNLGEQGNVTDEVLVKLTSISDNVLGINLSGELVKIHPQVLERCLSRCPNLKQLNMARCFDMPAEMFLSIGTCCPNLVYLDLDSCSNITNESIINVGKGCPSLERLYLAQCSLIKNTGIVEVARGCPLLKQLRIEQCDKITDQAIIELTKYCPDLNYLHLLSCSLTDSSICQLVKLPQLRMLDISNLTQLSPKVLTKVVDQCNKLEILNVSLNRAVDDECVKTIVKACSKLRVLSCVACRLTDKALEYVAEYSENMEHLDVAWCVDITNDGVKHISENVPSLKYLGLMQCRKVTFDMIDELIESFPRIHYSNFVTESRRILKKACAYEQYT